MTIIAVAGKARAGKDTFGEVLVKKHGFTRIALADALKNLCSRVLFLDPSMFEDENKDKQMARIHLDLHDIDAIRNIVETEYNYTIPYESREEMEEYHGREFDTPREALRCIGMMLRDHVDENIWIKIALDKIQAVKGKIVITDCRFQNERDTFAKIGAILCLVKRGDSSEMKEHEFSLGSENEYDVVFTNDSSLHSYKSSIDQWYSARAQEFQYYKVWEYSPEYEIHADGVKEKDKQ